MFDNIKENLKRANEERARKREEDARAAAARARDAQMAERQSAERERKIAGMKVITGDVKYQYVILDTLRSFAHYTAEPGEAYDPTAATMLATRQMQELAYATGADAVIHAQYQILRYGVSRRGYNDVPAYEAHVFGTAIKIVGPPPEWSADSEG